MPTHGKVGYVSANHNAVEDYVAFAVSTIDCRLDGMKIAVDCANGASYETAFKALNKLGANVEAIHNTPDGVNINHMCGSTHMESLQAYVTSIGADIGIALTVTRTECWLWTKTASLLTVTRLWRLVQSLCVITVH